MGLLANSTSGFGNVRVCAEKGSIGALRPRVQETYERAQTGAKATDENEGCKQTKMLAQAVD